MTSDADARDLATLSSPLRPVAAWACLCLSVAPYFTLLTVRHTESNVLDGPEWYWLIDLPWVVFPVFFASAVVLTKGRMRFLAMGFAFLFAPFIAEITEPKSGQVVDAPWYLTRDHTKTPLQD